MTIDPTCSSRETRKMAQPIAGVVESPVGARRRVHREPRIMSMQRVGHTVVDTPVAATKDASLATSRWCRYMDYRRRATSRRPCCCCRSHRSCCSCFFSSPCPCPCPCIWRCCWGWEQKGEGPPGDMAVPAMVGAEAAAATEGTLHLRTRSRKRRLVPGPSSGPARSPRARGRCGRCGRRGTVTTA
jgi:hypothetical protein